MSTFASAFTKTTNKTVTENGAVVESTTESPVLDFSHKVVRDTTKEEITNRISQIVNHAEKSKDVSILHDLFVLMFHKRNPRGGEGEKEMTYNMVISLYDYYPETIIKLLHLVGEFGYYKDLYQIWEKISKSINTELENTSLTNLQKKTIIESYYNKYNPLIQEIIKFSIKQRNNDLEKLEKGSHNISLLGKWLPSEGSHFAKHAHWYLYNKEQMLMRKTLVDMMIYHMATETGVNLDTERSFPKYWYMKYRKGNSLLSKQLKVPEIAMCAGRYADIKFEHVASRAMAQYRKAFMNEKLKVPLKSYEEATGNRYPDKEDRVKARQHLNEILISKKASKLKATVLEPHDIIQKISQYNISSMDMEVLTALWENKKTDVKKHLAEMLETLKQEGKDMGDVPRPGKIIPVVDVSGSMSYWQQTPSPLDVAISLGIMTAELHEDDSPFKDMLISFTDIPTNFKFRPEQTLYQRYREVKRHEGYNTNFRLVIEELLKLCILNDVKEEDIPDILVFTDGQFDDWGPKDHPWSTHYEELMKLWVAAGYTKVPRLIFWNLRGGTPGVQVKADCPGVQLLQGYSPNLLKFILYGESMEETTKEVIIDGKKVEVKVSSVTPWDTFRNIIDQSRYDIVRIALSESQEKLLTNYSFQPLIEESLDIEFVDNQPKQDDKEDDFEIV